MEQSIKGHALKKQRKHDCILETGEGDDNGHAYLDNLVDRHIDSIGRMELFLEDSGTLVLR